MESVMASWSSPSTINGLVLDDSSITTSIPLSQLFSSTTTNSPSSSPTLYDYGNGSSVSITNGNGVPKQTKMGSSRSQLAETLLRDIETGRDSQYPQADLLNEDFVNLELFQDLDNAFILGDTPPMSPLSPEHSYVNDKLYGSPTPSPLLLSEEEFPEETFNALNAEFQQILDSLPEGSFTVGSDEAMELIENIMDITEMEMVKEENTNGEDDNRSIASNSGDEDSSSQHSYEGQGQTMEVEYYITGDIQSLQLSPEHELEVEPEREADPEDVQAEVSVKILNALLDGNLAVAESYLPKTSNVEVTYPVQFVTLVPVPVAPEATASTSTSTKRTSTSSKKAPKTNQKKPRLPPRVDRVQRKKEQNKTAATRYREKKKILASVITQQEEELSAENLQLTEQKNDLARQISIVKQLLRDVMAAKKQQQQKVKPKKFGISSR